MQIFGYSPSMLVKHIGMRREAEAAAQETETKPEVTSLPHPVKKVKTVHSKQAPYIDPKDWGKVRFNTVKGSEPFHPNPDGLDIKYLFNHTLVFGGSGSGKTFTWGNQYLREIFRSTHIPPGPLREHLKPGICIIEAKGDYTPKAHRLACRYGRVEDCYWIGPGHLNSIDIFGDETESSNMKAQKMAIILDAYNGGQKGSDPFWSNNAILLYRAIFDLHAAIRKADPENVPPMDFKTLYILLQGSAGNRNQRELNAYRSELGELASAFDRDCAALRSILEEGAALAEKVVAVVTRAKEWLEEQPAVGGSEPVEEGDEEEEVEWKPQGPPPAEEEFCEWLEECANALTNEDVGVLTRMQRSEAILSAYLTDDEEWTADALVQKGMPQVDETVMYWTAFVNRWLNGIEVMTLKSEEIRLTEKMRQQMLEIGQKLQEVQAALRGAVGNCQRSLRKWVAKCEKPVKPEPFLIKKWVDAYRELMKQKGGGYDEVLEYFEGTFFNPEKDKTVAGITMQAAVVAGMLSAPPFSEMFSAKPTVRMLDILTKGAIIGLAMTFAAERDAAVLAAILFKLEFFRAAQSVDVLGLEKDRPIFLFTDELATVITSGEFTGEAGFVDKARGYGCGWLGMVQSFPMLLRKVSQAEIDSLYTNTQIKLFLRNDDPKTKELGSASSGEYERANASLTMSAEDAIKSSYQISTGHGVSVTFQREHRLKPHWFEEQPVGRGLLLLPAEPGIKSHERRRIIQLDGDPLDHICPACGEMRFKKYRVQGKVDGKDAMISYWQCGACKHKQDEFTEEIPLNWRNELILAERAAAEEAAKIRQVERFSEQQNQS
jgi:hypothetical protein